MGSKTYTIPVFDLIMSLSTAIDMLSPKLSGHHMRVAYISNALARALRIEDNERRELMIAATIHDIGAFSEAERIDLLRFEADDNPVHAAIGYEFLRRFRLFYGIAKLVRFHHLDWSHGREQDWTGEPVPRGSHLLHLADRVDVSIDQSSHILAQASRVRELISGGNGTKFRPEFVEAFLEISRYESFWLDLTYPHIDAFLSRDTALGSMVLNIEELGELALMFCHLIDFKSPYTATHSSGVAAAAAAISKLAGFSKIEQKEMGVAGLLHDLGKLALPAEILNKPASLTDDEFSKVRAHAYYSKRMLENIHDVSTIVGWGCAHHERMDGEGYPFHETEEELPLGARIVAVADVLTALSEDRPYRDGMPHTEILRILQEMADAGKLDRRLIGLVKENFNEVQQARSQAQKLAMDSYCEVSARLPLPSTDGAPQAVQTG